MKPLIILIAVLSLFIATPAEAKGAWILWSLSEEGYVIFNASDNMEGCQESLAKVVELTTRNLEFVKMIGGEKTIKKEGDKTTINETGGIGIFKDAQGKITQLIAIGNTATIRTGEKMLTYQCLPDTVDPRVPKK